MTVPNQNIRALYRRFLRFNLAIRYSRFDVYSYRYNILDSYPAIIRDIVHLNTDTVYKTTHLNRRWIPGGSQPRPENPHFSSIFLGWKSTRFALHKTLEKLVPLFFRNTLLNPAHPSYQQSAQNYTKLQSVANHHLPAEPISPHQIYQIGVRTLYFLERAMGLRPYVCYVEYGTPAPSKKKTTIALDNFVNPSNFLSTPPPSRRPQHLPSFLLPKPTTFPPMQSVNNLIKTTSELSAPPTTFYTNISNNRTRTITKIVPLTANPACLTSLPPQTQSILYTIHQYFSQIEAQMSNGVVVSTGGGVKMTGEQKQAILKQLDPQFQEILTNSFIINHNYRLEERLLQCITKANYFSVGYQNTVPLVIQRHQLVSLLRELQLLII